MTKKLMIKMLDQGSNGEQILSILDVIASNTVNEESSESFAVPTLDEISF